MKKLLDLGIVLDKIEQKKIHGGIHICALDGCPPGYVCIPTAPGAGCRLL